LSFAFLNIFTHEFTSKQDNLEGCVTVQTASGHQDRHTMVMSACPLDIPTLQMLNTSVSVHFTQHRLYGMIGFKMLFSFHTHQ
jgi:hypothetical protein